MLAASGLAHGGTALYDGESDAIKITNDSVTYGESGFTIAADFMASLNLPGPDGDLTVSAGDFTYTWNLESVAPEPSANTMFCGPMIGIGENVYGWLYGNKDGVLSMRSTGGHSEKGVVTLEETKGDPVPVTQMPAAVRMRREGSTLHLEYTYAQAMPFQAGDTMDLGPDASGDVTFKMMWSAVDVGLKSLEVMGDTVPDVNYTTGPEPPDGPGRALYTDAADVVQITEEGVSYENGNIVFEAGPYFTLPTAGGALTNTPPGDFVYTMLIEDIETPSYPMTFAALSVNINGADYLFQYRSSSEMGDPLQVRVTRGFHGGVVHALEDILAPVSALQIVREGNTLIFAYSIAAKDETFIELTTVDLADPLGDGSVDDSMGTAQFDILAFMDMTVSRIEVSGDYMYNVNDHYDVDPDVPEGELPVGSGAGLLVLGALMLGAALRRKA